MSEHLCPDCNRPQSAVEYSYNHAEHYDGVSEWWCERCGLRIGRWSGKRLAAGEPELRYGGVA